MDNDKAGKIELLKGDFAHRLALALAPTIKEGYIELRPANANYLPIRIDADDNFRVWGVVVWTIKQWRR